MQANNILQSDLLDILFENRNKAYGAYDLRKTYNKRLLVALGTMTFCCLFFSLSSLFAGEPEKKMAMPVIDVVLDPVKDNNKKEEPIPEPPAPAPPPAPAQIEQIRVTQSVTPQIVEDDQVNQDNQVKTVDELDKARIGNINVDGSDDIGNVAPVLPEAKGTGGNGTAIGGHGNEVVDNTPVVIVQVEARFPGGTEAWRRFLEKNLDRDAPVVNGAPPASKLTVVVSFIVDRDGNVSEVKAENDPGYGTASEAVRVIRKGPKWIPAIQNGRNVIYRQRQSVTFQVEEE